MWRSCADIPCAVGGARFPFWLLLRQLDAAMALLINTFFVRRVATGNMLALLPAASAPFTASSTAPLPPR